MSSGIVDRHLTEDYAKDHELQCTLRQAGHNNKLKKAVLDTEESINQFHSGEYNNSVQYQLQRHHKRADELISAYEAGLKWNLTTQYDIFKLLRQCGLELSVQELIRTDASPTYFDLIPVKKELSTHRKKVARAADNRPLLEQAGLPEAAERCAKRIEEVEALIKSSQLNAAPFAAIPGTIMPKIAECLSFVKVDEAISKTENEVDKLNDRLNDVKEMQQKSMQEGEMALAEDASYQVIQIMEDLMELVGDKFAVINEKNDENKGFQPVFDLLRESNKKTLAMKQERRRLKQRCQTDLASVHMAITKNDATDVAALKDFASFQVENRKALDENMKVQDQLWSDKNTKKYSAELDDIIENLRQAGRDRYQLVRTRVERVDKEEMRKVEYQQFLEVVAHHKKTLELTIHNCDIATTCIGHMEQIVNDVCVAIRNWHDIVRQELYDLRINVHKEHLAYFREQYLTIGNLLWKKQKRMDEIDRALRAEHVQLEFAIETFDLTAKKHSEAKKELAVLRADLTEEIAMLKGKAKQGLDEFEESEIALREAGFDFVHPEDEFKDMAIHQREKMISYKTQFHKDEDVRIAAEREEIRRMVAISPSRNLQLQAAANATSPVKRLDMSAA